MAREFLVSGEAGPEGWLQGTSASHHIYNDDVAVWAVYRLSQTEHSSGFLSIVAGLGTVSRGWYVGWRYLASGIRPVFNKTSSSNIVQVNAIDERGELGDWCAIMWHCGDGIGHTCKRVNLRTGAFQTGFTPNSAAMDNAVAGDNVAVGNTSYTFTHATNHFGDIHRVVLSNPSGIPSDDAVRQWAYAQQPPDNVTASWTCFNENPELDESGNEISIAVNGTLNDTGAGPPLGVRASWDFDESLIPTGVAIRTTERP